MGRSRIVAAMSVRLGYDVSGPRDAPVLVPGGWLGTDRRMWKPQLAGLRERFRVVCYDHRGHGASPVPVPPYTIQELAGDVIELIDRLRSHDEDWACA
jgi:3-oxoadipate enol-lactonase